MVGRHPEGADDDLVMFANEQYIPRSHNGRSVHILDTAGKWLMKVMELI